jgi:pimeloyl-ACP methyl ester carboxylesterase
VPASASKDVKLTSAPCLSSLGSHPKGLTYASASYVQGKSIPSVSEVLADGPRVHQTWQRLEHALSLCHVATIRLGTTNVTARIRPLAFPKLGGIASAYTFSFTIAGIRIASDLVNFEVGRYGGYITYADLGAPPLATVSAFLHAASAKAGAGSTAQIADADSIASAPVLTAHTALGTVGYRVLGAGPPLVMIMGYGGNMEVWDRSLVDALAQHHRVVIFDNAGIGQTQALPAPLTIDAMANQTSALIDTLKLGRTDVLGWSMGSMIAQALTVLHPTQVRRVVLAASFPGTGVTIRPTEAAIHTLTSGNEQQVTAALFPADQAGAGLSYLTGLSGYPASPSVPAAIVTAQGHAVDGWWSGQDPAGRKANTIGVPTLIGDGTEDRIDPVANSHALAKLIPEAKLQLYPDAGHAFLFQDQGTFAPLIESFLSATRAKP